MPLKDGDIHPDATAEIDGILAQSGVVADEQARSVLAFVRIWDQVLEGRKTLKAGRVKILPPAPHEGELFVMIFTVGGPGTLAVTIQTGEGRRIVLAVVAFESAERHVVEQAESVALGRASRRLSDAL